MRSFSNYLAEKNNIKKWNGIERFKKSGWKSRDPEFNNYSILDLMRDISLIKEHFSEKFLPNEKLVENILEKFEETKEPQLLEEVVKLENKLFYILEEVQFKVSLMSDIQYEDNIRTLWLFTKYIANNGINPEDKWAPNSDKRWTNILRKIGYD